MIIYIKLNPKSPLNQRRFPILFEFYINPPYPKNQPVVLCKSHFSFPSLFDNRNFGQCLTKRWSPQNHLNLITEMIENLPNLITKYEIDVDHSLFYYEGEYSYTFAYNVNDFILNGENYLYKVKINQKGMKNDEDNLVYLVITDLHLLLIKPENEQKNKGKIFYIGNLVDIDSFAEQQFYSGNSIVDPGEITVQIKYKPNVQVKFVYLIQFNKENFDFISLVIMQRKKKFEKIFDFYYPNNSFDPNDDNEIEKLKAIIHIREKEVNAKGKEFYVSKNLMELYQKMIEIYSLREDENYKKYITKFQDIVQKFSK